MKTIISALLTTQLLFLSFFISVAQPKTNDSSLNGISAAASLGITYGTQKNGGIASLVKLNGYHNNYTLTMMYKYVDGIDVLTSPQTYSNEFGLLAGKNLHINSFRFKYQAGLCYIKGVMRGDYLGESGGDFLTSSIYERINYQTIGIPLNLGFQFVFFRYVGIGVEVLGNVNPKQSYFTPMLTLEIGKLR